jgi:hypothetical protein
VGKSRVAREGHVAAKVDLNARVWTWPKIDSESLDGSPTPGPFSISCNETRRTVDEAAEKLAKYD